jgi:predicted glutamine amidotransferase
MCVIAVVNQDSAPISDEHWENCWDGNPDGFGLMWVDSGVIQMFKSLNKDTAWEKSKEVVRDFHDKSPIVMHWRIGTQGVGLDNCHPFFVNDRIAFCHNGIIGQFSTAEDRKTGRSDTRLFNEYILSCLDDGFEKNETTVDLIEDYIGSDKLVFLDRDGVVTIMNSKCGVFDKGTNTWYSNNSYNHKKFQFSSVKMPAKKPLVQKRETVTISYKGKTITVPVAELSMPTSAELGLLFKKAEEEKTLDDIMAEYEAMLQKETKEREFLRKEMRPDMYIEKILFTKFYRNKQKALDETGFEKQCAKEKTAN